MDNENADIKDLIRCDDGECIYYIPKDLFAELVLKSQAPRRSKYVRYKEGAELYSMSLCHFKGFAREAGAVSKINGTVLVDTDILDKYIEYFRVK